MFQLHSASLNVTIRQALAGQIGIAFLAAADRLPTRWLLTGAVSDRDLLLAAAWALRLVLAYAGLATLAAAAPLLFPRRPRWAHRVARCAPSRLRHLVTAWLVVTTVAGTATVADATPDPGVGSSVTTPAGPSGPQWPITPAPTAVTISPSPADERAPIVAAAPGVEVSPTHSAPQGPAYAEVVVRPGDSLWSIAAAGLVHPSDTQVSAAWPSWWAANRDVIGPDPSLIHPGQRLHPPAAQTRSTP